jgi:hypothetical protein
VFVAIAFSLNGTVTGKDVHMDLGTGALDTMHTSFNCGLLQVFHSYCDLSLLRCTDPESISEEAAQRLLKGSAF